MTTGAISLWPTAASPGMHHSLCLFVTPASMRSILGLPLLISEASREKPREMPFIVAVSAQAVSDQAAGGEGEDETSWRGFFNVAVEVLLTGLFPAVADDKLEPFEVGGHVHGQDIWLDHARWGVHKVTS